jgi:hypothetical protein
VAWVVKVVAEALHYAHGQQTFHRDVKPANVLLTLQHGPQLLDFNLAESPHSASQAQAAMHGGTLPYMAPEQIEAFLDHSLWGKVGAQADVYSLGLVLRELLTGQAPDLPAETLAPARAMRVLLDRRPLLDDSVRKANPAIPHGLEAIVAKCLAVSTEERYADAGALAEDLRRFLEHQPLVHAVNLSSRERVANWAYRNRLRLAVAAACLLPVVFLCGGVAIGRSMAVWRPSQPIEMTSLFQSAVALLDKKLAEDSIKPWKELKETYPDSPLPRLYLSLAYNVSDNKMDAANNLEALVQMPNAEDVVVAWGRKHPEVAAQLVRFAEDRNDKGTDAKYDSNLSDGGRGAKQNEHYRLAMAAGRLAHQIYSDSNEGDSDLSAYNLALAEQELKSYESVIQRADRAIESSRSQQPADDAEERKLERSLFNWRRLRARAFTKLAQQSRDEEVKAPREKALKDLDAAIKDLNLCSSFATKYNSTLDLHSVERVRAEALMARIEIELDLGRIVAAKRSRDLAWKSLTRYEDLAKILDRSYELEAFHKRFKDTDARLRQDEAKKSGEAEGKAEGTSDRSLDRPGILGPGLRVGQN